MMDENNGWWEQPSVIRLYEQRRGSFIGFPTNLPNL